jgi:enamine deaminase RidA (YjgF/YER057c/UK114 family)
MMGPGRGFDPTDTRHINPGTLAGLDGFTHAVRVGSFVFVSGEVPLDSVGNLVGRGDLAAQARQAFANLELVLHLAGTTPQEVVKLTVYVSGYKPADLAVIREAGPAFFPQRNAPAGVVVGVQSLPREGMLIAVDATAVIKAMFRARN